MTHLLSPQWYKQAVSTTKCRLWQMVNNYDLDVFNGDIGVVTALTEDLDSVSKPTATIEFATGRYHQVPSAGAI